MKPLPTDLEILNAIYEHHYNDFAFHADKRPKKTIVPVNIVAVAERLGVDADIVFGRLRYHLDPKYKYEGNRLDPETRVVRLFLSPTDYDVQGHSVHFPYLASVLAELRDEERKRQTQNRIAWFSLAVSGLAVLISFLALLV